MLKSLRTLSIVVFSAVVILFGAFVPLAGTGVYRYLSERIDEFVFKVSEGSPLEFVASVMLLAVLLSILVVVAAKAADRALTRFFDKSWAPKPNFL